MLQIGPDEAETGHNGLQWFKYYQPPKERDTGPVFTTTALMNTTAVH